MDEPYTSPPCTREKDPPESLRVDRRDKRDLFRGVGWLSVGLSVGQLPGTRFMLTVQSSLIYRTTSVLSGRLRRLLWKSNWYPGVVKKYESGINKYDCLPLLQLLIDLFLYYSPIKDDPPPDTNYYWNVLMEGLIQKKLLSTLFNGKDQTVTVSQKLLYTYYPPPWGDWLRGINWWSSDLATSWSSCMLVDSDTFLTD